MIADRVEAYSPADRVACGLALGGDGVLGALAAVAVQGPWVMGRPVTGGQGRRASAGGGLA